MRRIGGLWPELVSLRNLTLAAEAAARGKRQRSDVAAFLLGLEPELLALRRELLDGRYQPGPYRTFLVEEPKPRIISAAPFRDRVVHHALTLVLEPIFERRFSPFSFACRRGKGAHRALRLAQAAIGRHRFFLKCDVKKYFASIDHELLMGLLGRAVKCRKTLALANTIVAGSNPQEPVLACFPGDDLFAPHQRRRGLPLGNQTSQFFANVYLDPLDQLVTRALRPGAYARYVDDVVVFGDDRDDLGRIRDAIRARLASLRLRLHAERAVLREGREGLTFLGYRLFPGRTRLVRGNVTRARRRLRHLQAAYASGVVGWGEVESRVRAWIAHAAWADTWRLREALFAEYTFVRDAT